MNSSYPLLFEPNLHTVVWGGDRLCRWKGLPEQDNIGESWEVSAVESSPSVVANGCWAGKTLPEVVASAPEEILGKAVAKRNGGKMPLLVKFIDARKDLSIQVHPNDEMALREHNKLGKSEMWYVLDAEPGACIYAGFKKKLQADEYKRMVEDGTITEALARHEAHAGDVFYIPSGTIHALGPGIQCYEIQESSDVTYRFWDWGRTGKDGRPRELHTEKALAVSNTGPVPGQVSPAGRPVPGGLSTLLADDPHFQLYAADLDGTFSTDAGRMQFLTPTVPCTVSWDTSELALAPYRSMLIPADMGPVRLSGRGRVLISRIP